MEYKTEGDTSLFLHQIIDFAPAPAPAQPVLSRNRLRPPTPLHGCSQYLYNMRNIPRVADYGMMISM